MRLLLCATFEFSWRAVKILLHLIIYSVRLYSQVPLPLPGGGMVVNNVMVCRCSATNKILPVVRLYQ